METLLQTGNPKQLLDRHFPPQPETAEHALQTQRCLPRARDLHDITLPVTTNQEICYQKVISFIVKLCIITCEVLRRLHFCSAGGMTLPLG